MPFEKKNPLHDSSYIIMLSQYWNNVFDFQFRLAPLWSATTNLTTHEWFREVVKGRLRGVYLKKNQIRQNIHNLELVEKNLIQEVLEKTNYKKSEAIKLLNISRHSLDGRIKKYDL